MTKILIVNSNINLKNSLQIFINNKIYFKYQ